MKQVNFILIDETGGQEASRHISSCRLPGIKHHIIIKGVGRSREDLLERVAEKRRHYPEAKILGVQELDVYCVRASEEMNGLRRKLKTLTNNQ